MNAAVPLAPPAGGHYLAAWLAPLAPLLARADVTDVWVNAPGEAWTESLGGTIERHDVPALDGALLWRLARQVASLSHQGISRAHPLLSATLPDGARVQIVAPPATRAHMAIAIRKHVMQDMGLGDFFAAGAFDRAVLTDAPVARRRLAAGDDGSPGGLAALLGDLVRARANIVIAGGTSTGKTTLLNALIREIPADERLIFIEDTPELRIGHANAVGLVAVRGQLGEAEVSAADLLQAALRMRPDRIVLGEVRGAEAATWLRAVQTGHPGSITTIHADSPEGAIAQLALTVMQSGLALRSADIIASVRGIVDAIVQVARVDGRRVISRIALVQPEAPA